MVPPAGLGSATSAPSCASTIVQQIDRPTPHPVGVGCDEGLEQTVSHLGCDTGTGVGAAVSTAPSAPGAALAVSSRRREPCRASIGFRIRLTTSCLIWSRSTVISGGPGAMP